MTERAHLSVEAAGSPDSRAGEWVVTLDLEDSTFDGFSSELAVRALAVAVAGTRTYVAARAGGYSFTVIVGTTGPSPLRAALARALELLSVAQSRAGLGDGAVVCAEVTLVGSRPVPAAGLSPEGCENPAS